MDFVLTKEIIQKTKCNYDKIAAQFSATRAYPRRVMQYFVKKYVRSGMKILDVGCGNGILFSLLKDLKVNYLGIDISSELVAEAKKKFPEANFASQRLGCGAGPAPQKPWHGINFLVQDALKMDFPENNFDLIFSFAFLHHLSSQKLREEFFKKVYKILKPDGHLICTVWNLFEKSWRAGEKNYLRMKKIVNSKNNFLISWKNSQGRVLAERYYYAFTLEELKNLFIKADFKIEEMFYENNGEKTENILEGKNICLAAKK